MDAAVIEKEALMLPEAQRALLADRLLESLSGSSQATVDAWLVEAESRWEAYQRGEIQAVDGPSAMAALKERFSK